MEQQTFKRPKVTPPAAPARDPIPYRQIVGGAAALLLAMLLIVLFPRVVRVTGQTSATATQPATAQPTSVLPTATATPLTAEGVWGSALTRHSLLLSDGTSFTPTDVAPDGSLLVGYAVAQPSAPYYITAVALPSFTAQRLFTLPADATKPIVKTDGTFAGWLGANTPTSTGAVHQTIGYVNIATGRYAELYDAFSLQYDPRFFAVAAGQFLYSPVKSPNTLNVLDMTTGNSAPLPLHVPTGATLATLTVAWPLLVYTASDQSVHVYDNQNQLDAPLSVLTFASVTDTLALAGKTLYWAHPASGGNALQVTAFAAITDPTVTGQVITMVAASRLTQLTAGSRLLTWSDGQTRAAYDLDHHAQVQLGPTVAGDAMQMGQQGKMLWYRSDTANQPAITLVNGAQL
ncbi:MAG: hypothetical protein H0X24_02980 [Ktedonobacterales bacterium]|nr:hypothetical protein [Ktedonobacterales bacterium]